MATELGQAYVQIMPSAKGISGSIQKTLDPEAISAGKSAGSKIASSISDSLGKAGKKLTKAITVPALGAAAAAGGIVAAFGWKRLTGLDSAKAQLKGLGYEAESVDRISTLVKDAIQGTVTTMAEGVSVAAGALAAGVEEGAELERYIKLVGDAAVGANRPIDDMAMIFNRVQGSGKLMTQELNMIEQGMPGFAQAMADNLADGSQETFREMVTNGEVGSEEFLNVMEGFAGDMSEAYANSWQGIVSNTKAWIGIIGENILGGVFEQSKESISEFMEYLKSDDVQEWAQETGQKIGEAFERMIDSVKSAIEWWTGLDDGTKKLIKTIALIVVAIGPVLMIISKLIGIVITVHKWFGLLKVAAGIIGGAIGAISAPVWIAIGAIAAIIAIGIALWKNWDTVKAKASQLGNWISNKFNSIKNVISNIWSNIRNTTSNVWNGIRNTITNLINSIRNTFSNIFNGLRNIVSNAFNNVKNAVRNGMSSAFNAVSNFFGRFKDAGKRIVTSIADGIKGAIGKVTGAIGNVASKIRNFLPFSPPKEGPLMDIMDVKWGETIGGGIEKGEGAVAKAMEDMLAFDITKKATFSSPQRYDESGRDITIHNTFTSKEMTPSEIARKEKQMLQRLAMEGVL